MFIGGLIEHWGRGLSMMNNECERIGLPEPRITDNGFMVKVIFKKPSAAEYKKDTVTLEKDTVNLENDTVASKKDTVEHQLKEKKTPAEKRKRQELRIINIIGEDWSSASELCEMLGHKSKSTFIKSYLNPMVESGLLVKEKLDSINASNQRYGLTVKGKAIYYSNK